MMDGIRNLTHHYISFPLSAMLEGPEAFQRAVAAAAMAEEMYSELGEVLSSPRFTEAVRAAVQQTFRAVAAHIYTHGFTSAPLLYCSGSCAPPPTIPEHGPTSSEIPQQNLTPPASPSPIGRPERPQYKRTDSHVFGSVPSGGGRAGAKKVPRQLARVLKSVQAAGDASFASITKVTKGISELGPVLALSATAFTCASRVSLMPDEFRV